MVYLLKMGGSFHGYVTNNQMVMVIYHILFILVPTRNNDMVNTLFINHINIISHVSVSPIYEPH